jgi:hypothetical protein
MRNDPDYHNWLVVGQALVLLSDGLGKYAENKMKALHALITTNVGGPGVKCHCMCTYGKKPKPHGPAHPHGRPRTPCIWARELKNHHVFSQKEEIPWHQSVGTHWDDPVHGYWEIAKLFMSDLGKNWTTTKDPGTTDCGSLLSLLMFCNHFKIQKNTLKAIKCWRNTWAHSPMLILTDKEKKDAFTVFDNLMTDPELGGIKEAQDCRQAIKEMETADISILEKKELMIIQFQNQELKRTLNEAIETMGVAKGEIKETKEEIKQAKEKIEETKEEIKETKEEIKETKEEIKMANDKIGVVFITILLYAVSSFSRNIPGLLWSLMAFFMFSQVGDRSVILDYGKIYLCKHIFKMHLLQERKHSARGLTRYKLNTHTPVTKPARHAMQIFPRS